MDFVEKLVLEQYRIFYFHVINIGVKFECSDLLV